MARIKLMNNAGKKDDLITREDAIKTVSAVEGIYPSSLWYTPSYPALQRAEQIAETMMRMCGQYDTCNDCPLNGKHCTNIWTEEQVKIIEDWAAKNEEE